VRGYDKYTTKLKAKISDLEKENADLRAYKENCEG
jgi:hypothetical protein